MHVEAGIISRGFCDLFPLSFSVPWSLLVLFKEWPGGGGWRRPGHFFGLFLSVCIYILVVDE